MLIYVVTYVTSLVAEYRRKINNEKPFYLFKPFWSFTLIKFSSS